MSISENNEINDVLGNENIPQPGTITYNIIWLSSLSTMGKILQKSVKSRAILHFSLAKTAFKTKA